MANVQTLHSPLFTVHSLLFHDPVRKAQHSKPADGKLVVTYNEH